MDTLLMQGLINMAVVINYNRKRALSLLALDFLSHKHHEKLC